MSNPYQIGDPVMDAAQGRAMVVLDAPEQTVAEWSDANNYELTENYANGKFDPDSEEYVVRCAYVSDVRSEPSKDYTFPVSRVVLIDAHHADDGRRIADRVIEDLVARLFGVAIDEAASPSVSDVSAMLYHAGVADDIREVGEELAKAAREGAE